MAKLTNLSTDFDSIALDIEDDLKSRGTIGKSLFPGSAGALFKDTSAAIMTSLTYRIDMAVLNSFMSTAFAKSSVYALSSTLGASPARKRGAIVTVLLTVNSTLTDNIIIPKYTRFSLRELTWYTREEYILTSSTTTLDVTLYQGEPLIEEFSGNGLEFQEIILAEDNFSIEENVLEVIINEENWTRERKSLFRYQEESIRNVFLEDTTPDGKVKLVFGNGKFGNVPVGGDIIYVKYIKTDGLSSNSSIVGDEAKLLDLIAVTDELDLDVSCVTTTTSSSADNEDSVELLKYTSPRLLAANERSVRRDDYEANLRKYAGVLASKTWGEYEEAKKLGYQSNSMMNRVFFSLVKKDMASKSENISEAAVAETTTYTKTLSNLIPIPGSLVIKHTTSPIIWKDVNGYLTSSDISFNVIDGNGTSYSDDEDGANVADFAFDGDESTVWSSSNVPSDLNPINLTYDFGVGNEETISTIRIQSSDELSANARAFPKLIIISGSNVATPNPVTSEDWSVIAGVTELQDPGVRGWSDWIKIGSSVAYRHIRIQVISREGNYNGVKIGNVELQNKEDASTIDYVTGDVVLKYQAGLLETGEIISSTYLVSDFTTSELSDIQTSFDELKHFSTEMVYKSPIAKMVDVVLDVFYFQNVINPNTLKTEVEAAVRELLEVNENSFSRDLKKSDLVHSAKITGVDYIEVQSPTFNVIANLEQFVALNSITINMIKSSR